MNIILIGLPTSGKSTVGVILRDGESIEELFAEREALYNRYADEVVPKEGLRLEETVHAVRKRVLLAAQNNTT